jgi:hypothetical protein
VKSAKPIVHRVCCWCQTPLTKVQIYRRRSHCSRSCAKERYHAMHPGAATACLRPGWATLRQQYVERVKRRLQGCRTLGDAYRLGYATGYRAGWTRVERRRRAA